MNIKMLLLAMVVALGLPTHSSGQSDSVELMSRSSKPNLRANFQNLLANGGLIGEVELNRFGVTIHSLNQKKSREILDRKASSSAQRRGIEGVVKNAESISGLIVSPRFDAGDPHSKTLIDKIEKADQRLKFVRAMALGDLVFEFFNAIDVVEADTVRLKVLVLGESIEDVSLDYQMTGHFVPNDPGFSLQHGLLLTQSYGGGTDATLAWDVTQGSNGIVVAVVDSGVRFEHPDLVGRLLPGFDFVSNINAAGDGDGRDADASDPGNGVTAAEAQRLGCSPAPSNWHGTHVAGILGASSNNGRGISGVDWRARLLPVRVLGKCGRGTTSDVLDGMAWAAGVSIYGVPDNPNPARIINMSLGGKVPGGCSWTMQKYIQAVKERSVLIVVAAGNTNEDLTTEVPASCDGVLTVGAVDLYGLRSSFSNYSSSYKVSISAPGGDISYYGNPESGILSTVDAGTLGPQSPSYDFYQGTSMAAPFVAGAAALALSVNRDLTPPELTALLEVTSTDFTKPDSCRELFPICGAGIVNMRRAVQGAAYLLDYITVAEYFNIDNNHFFRTGYRNEFAFVESGKVGRWINSEDYFLAWKNGASGALPVCRFYTPTSNSHFYTVDVRECELVKGYEGWLYEGVAFYAKKPINGVCPDGTVAVHRFYNNRFAFLDSNHKFTIYGEFYKPLLLANGWVYEGVAMCGAA